MGILNKTKFYQVGAMEADENGSQWREYVDTKLNKIGIISWSPYSKPYLINKDCVNESKEYQQKLIDARVNGDYNFISKEARNFRSYDLGLVDKADAIFFYLNPKVMTCGSWEEFFWANRLMKPIFLVVAGGKAAAPLWVFGTISHHYIYSTLDEAIEMIYKIDDGRMEIDSKRWKLLDYKYR